MRFGAGEVAGIKKAMRQFSKDEAKEIARLATNDIAFEVFRENKTLIKKSFDSPTRFTVNSFMVRKATTSNPVATVERKPFLAKRHYLEVQSEGGQRGQTGVEKLLARRLKYAGLINSVLPTKHMRRNKFGNVSKGQMQKILSGVSSQRDSRNNSTVRSEAQNKGLSAEFFVPDLDSKLTPGVWERRGKRIRKLLAFSDSAPRYDAAFPMEERAHKVASEYCEHAYERAFRRVMSN